MAANKQSTQVAVVGAGPGGYAAAFLAADLGLKATLIDTRPNPGGVCNWVGCIPSKALLHIAKVISEAKQAKHCGVTFGPPRINAKKIRAWKDGIVNDLTGGLGQLVKHRKIDFVQGHASFRDATTLEIQQDGGVRTLAFEHAIIATGSRPTAIPSLQLDSPRILDSTTALDLDGIPKSMLVIGGGYIGLELGSVYATLGSRVSVVEMLPGILPGADKDLVRVLQRAVEPLFETIMLNTTVKTLKAQKNGIKVQFEGAGAPDKDPLFEKVLVSVGRKPNSSELGLENTRVQINDRGFIHVDPARRTDEVTIFAIGDVVGEPMLAHKASHEGRTAVEVIAGHDVVFDPAVIPAVVFTDPEIAWCGLSEAQAKAAGREVKVAKFPWAASGRTRTLGRSEGLTKLLIDAESERVLGAGIVGVGAGELIAECALAIEMGAVAADLKLTVHPHPTLSETIMESAEVFFGQSSHVYRPKRG